MQTSWSWALKWNSFCVIIQIKYLALLLGWGICQLSNVKLDEAGEAKRKSRLGKRGPSVSIVTFRHHPCTVVKKHQCVFCPIFSPNLPSGQFNSLLQVKAQCSQCVYLFWSLLNKSEDCYPYFHNSSFLHQNRKQ